MVMNTQPQIDIIVRFHDVNHLMELKRCIFSLVGQEYRPLNIIVSLQRFSPEQIEVVKSTLAPMLSLYDAPTIKFVNFENEQPKDARSKLINIGIEAATGRFLAFLDYDDIMYPEAYKTLIARALAKQAAICFASVRLMNVHPYKDFIHPLQKRGGFPGSTLRELFRGNFCPIHSYIFDRSLITSELYYDEALNWEEDYDMLLRVCAKFKSDFSLIGTELGDYIHKDDGSNTVACANGISGDKMKGYAAVKANNERKRQITTISTDVQKSLGITVPIDSLTIRDFLSLPRK